MAFSTFSGAVAASVKVGRIASVVAVMVARKAKRGDIVDFPKIVGSIKLDCKVQLVHSSIAIMPVWSEAGSSAEPIPNL